MAFEQDETVYGVVQCSAALSVETVRANYRGTEALHGIDIAVAPSEFVTLLGPSGCGKSTALRCIAGLHRIDSGRIRLAGKTVAGAGVHVRPEKRNINMVFQSYAIWPHMTVFDNVAFGLRKTLRGAALWDRVVRMLELVGLEEFSNRHATGLSGGQQQRVALARALATDPEILLLDEPLSNLDSVLRARMRAEILRIQKATGKATLYVTHDCSEALAMSDRVIVMNGGRVAQAGPPATLYDRPKSRFVAEFLGAANFLRAKVVQADNRGALVAVPGLKGSPCLTLQPGPEEWPPIDAWVDLVVRPEHIRPSRQGEPETAAAEIIDLRFEGARIALTARSGDELLQFECDRRVPDLRIGGHMRLHIDAERVGWILPEG